MYEMEGPRAAPPPALRRLLGRDVLRGGCLGTAGKPITQMPCAPWRHLSRFPAVRPGVPVLTASPQVP